MVSHQSFTFSISASVLETSGEYFSVQLSITALNSAMVWDPLWSNGRGEPCHTVAPAVEPLQATCSNKTGSGPRGLPRPAGTPMSSARGKRRYAKEVCQVPDTPGVLSCD